MLQYQNAQFDYEPYPVCYVKDVLDAEAYRALVETYPAKDLFECKPNLGHKYSLSELNNPENYDKFLSQTPVWKSFYDHVKSPGFVENVLSCLPPTISISV